MMKNIFHVVFYELTKFHCLRLPSLCVILGNMFIVIVCKPGCDVINFEINLIFLLKSFFPRFHGNKQNNFLSMISSFPYRNSRSQMFINTAPLKNLFVIYGEFNQSHATSLFLYPTKTTKNLWLSDVFRGCRKRPVAQIGLIALFLMMLKAIWKLCI